MNEAIHGLRGHPQQVSDFSRSKEIRVRESTQLFQNGVHDSYLACKRTGVFITSEGLKKYVTYRLPESADEFFYQYYTIFKERDQKRRDYAKNSTVQGSNEQVLALKRAEELVMEDSRNEVAWIRSHGFNFYLTNSKRIKKELEKDNRNFAFYDENLNPYLPKSMETSLDNADELLYKVPVFILDLARLKYNLASCVICGRSLIGKNRRAKTCRQACRKIKSRGEAILKGIRPDLWINPRT